MPVVDGEKFVVQGLQPNRYWRKDEIIPSSAIEGGGGGAGEFIELSDVPSDYTGHAQKFVKVTAGEDGLEFVAGSGVATEWGDITGTLADQTDLQTALDAKVESLGDLSVTATASELNALDGITSTVTELNYTDGVTSAIQTQLDGKASTTLNNLGTTSINAHLLLSADATHDIGSSTVGINDLHFGSGGIINFDGGDVTLTHSANKLTLAGAANGYVITSASAASTRETVARFNVSDSTNDAILITNGTNTDSRFVPIIGGIYDTSADRTALEARGYITSSNDSGTTPVVTFNALQTSSATDPSNGTFAAIATRPLFQWQNNGTAAFSIAADRSVTIGNTSVSPLVSNGAALGTTSLQWSDLFLASGGVVNFNNGNATLTHSSGLLTSNVDVVVPAEAYGAGWNGSNEVPTKNDVYDKIETITGASGITAVVEDETPQLGGDLDLNTFTVGDASAADLTKLSEVTSTSAELNALDGITATVTELNYTDGVTSAIQTQLDAKAPLASPVFTGTPTIPSFASATHDHEDAAGGGTLGDAALATTADVLISSVGITIDGGGSAITTGFKGFVLIPFNCVITEWTILSADAGTPTSGSIVIDIWKDTYANFPPAVADTITASDKPTITTSTKGQGSALTGWTTTCTAGDILGFNVDSCTDIEKVFVILKLRKT